MPWLPNGYAVCDTCGLERVCVEDRHMAIQMMRAAGWGHMKGLTEGGQEFETILCRGCRKDERKRSRNTPTMEQDVLPLDFEGGRETIGRQGFSSR